jgi:CRP-like cAMP-binding protein
MDETNRMPDQERSPSHHFEDVFAAIGGCKRFAEGQRIFGEGDPASAAYKVVSGGIRLAKMTTPGHRQIAAFCVPGDMFGFEPDNVHRFFAEALTDSEILILRVAQLYTRATEDPAIMLQLWAQTTALLRTALEHQLLVNHSTAQQRVANFILDMADRRGPPASSICRCRASILPTTLL